MESSSVQRQHNESFILASTHELTPLHQQSDSITFLTMSVVNKAKDGSTHQAVQNDLVGLFRPMAVSNMSKSIKKPVLANGTPNPNCSLLNSTALRPLETSSHLNSPASSVILISFAGFSRYPSKDVKTSTTTAAFSCRLIPS